MKQLNQKTPWVFRLGVTLLCVMLMTTHLTGNLYARYSTTDSGSDSARVAKFEVTDTWQDGDTAVQNFAVSLAPGESKYYTVAIQNKGEVAVKYTVKLDNTTNNLPIEDAEIQLAELNPNANATTVFTISWPKSETDESYVGQMDIFQITVTVEQVD